VRYEVLGKWTLLKVFEQTQADEVIEDIGPGRRTFQRGRAQPWEKKWSSWLVKIITTGLANRATNT